jgi:hypothetical protein
MRAYWSVRKSPGGIASNSGPKLLAVLFGPGFRMVRAGLARPHTFAVQCSFEGREGPSYVPSAR